jgi:putative GTP pyrophosphokinase
MPSSLPDRVSIKSEFDRYLPARLDLVKGLREQVEKAVVALPSNVTVRGRVKSFYSYYKKYLRYLKAGIGGTPPKIPDIVGIRVICPFLEDLEHAEEALRAAFDVLEVEHKGEGESFNKFGYHSIHILVKVPDTLREGLNLPEDEAAEIQVRTILQEAWAEVEHELVYKAEFTPYDNTMKRKLAAVNASLSLADIIFEEVRGYQRKLTAQLSARHTAFFNKIETETDATLFPVEENPETSAQAPQVLFPAPSKSKAIDDLLLNALFAHNRGLFDDAITFYTKIIEQQPETRVLSLIYNHRGMAHFARSDYNEALADFSAGISLSADSYKAYYYRGVVQSVLRNYSAAIDDFSRSLELNPYQSYALYRRAFARYHAGDYTEALSDCEAALRVNADTEGAQKLKALLLAKLKL